MKELRRFLYKDNQKKYLEIFMILEELSRKENIISFSYSNNYLFVRVGLNDYYRINLKEVNQC